jgi:hypothetical protein
MISLILCTAHDFRARLPFPRVAREPPLLACGVTIPSGVSVLRSNQPLEAMNKYLKKPEFICLILGE